MSKLVIIVAVLTALAGIVMEDLHGYLGRRIKNSLPAELNNGNIQEDSGFGTSLCSICHWSTGQSEVSQ